MATFLQKSASYELPKWLWLWAVPLILILQLIIRAISPEFATNYLSGELGIIENFTVVILIPTIMITVYILMSRSQLPSPWLIPWYAMLGLACVYFAGEEASWGQHWFQWETPDSVSRLNDQGETNLHNMSSWFDQKPRIIVEISALIGGVLLPLARRIKGASFTEGSWQSLFWPTWVCLPVSLIVGFIKYPDRLFGTANIPYPFNLRVSETQELYVAMAFLIYLSSVAVRLHSQRRL